MNYNGGLRTELRRSVGVDHGDLGKGSYHTFSWVGTDGDVPFTGLVAEPLVFYSLRNAHKTPFFRMGYITLSQGMFLLRSTANSEGPGSRARSRGSHEFHGAQQSMDSMNFLGPEALSEIGLAI